MIKPDHEGLIDRCSWKLLENKFYCFG